jgi:hypothetical protein
MGIFKKEEPKGWYIVAVVKGHRYADGAYKTEKEAREKAWKSLQGVVFDVVPSDELNKAKFYQTCKHEVWEETGDFEEAVGRMKHKVTDKDREELENDRQHKL